MIHHKTLKAWDNFYEEVYGNSFHPYTVGKIQELSDASIEALREDYRQSRADESFDQFFFYQLAYHLHLDEPDDLGDPITALAAFFTEELEEREYLSIVDNRDGLFYILLYPNEEQWIQDQLNTTYKGVQFMFDEAEVEDDSTE